MKYKTALSLEYRMRLSNIVHVGKYVYEWNSFEDIEAEHWLVGSGHSLCSLITWLNI